MVNWRDHDVEGLIRKPQCTRQRSSAVKKEIQRTSSVALGHGPLERYVEGEAAVEQRRLAVEMRRPEAATRNLFLPVLSWPNHKSGRRILASIAMVRCPNDSSTPLIGMAKRVRQLLAPLPVFCNERQRPNRTPASRCGQLPCVPRQFHPTS